MYFETYNTESFFQVYFKPINYYRSYVLLSKAGHTLDRLGSCKRQRTASEPISTRDSVSFHNTVVQNGKFIIYANYNLILTRTLYYC
jgi:hypothetical protein